jgi:hypothetical protein
MVVCGADGIARRVGKLQFNVLVRVALLVQDRGSESPETMSGHPALVSHALKSFQNGIVAHGLLRVAVSGEEPIAFPGQCPQGIQHVQCLSC